MKFPTIPVAELLRTGEAEVKTGPFGTQLKASDYVSEGTPVINVRNIGFGNIREDKLEYIGKETVQRLASHLLRPEDIVFGRKGAVERHVFIQSGQSNWFQGSDCLRLRLSSGRLFPRFVSYYLLTHEHQQWMMSQCSHGATMASLNQDIISRIQLPCPPVDTQRRIASILSAYDDLIENNTRRIAILEEMARRIYEEWFVRFRFPGYEQVKMVESELGLIPEGWQVTNLDAVSEYINRGLTPKYDDLASGIVINQKCIRGQKLSYEQVRRQSKPIPADKRVRYGDVLINSTGVGTLGRVAQVLDERPNCTADTHVTIVRPGKQVTTHYYGLSLLAREEYFEQQGVGATGQTELGRGRVAETTFIVPPLVVQEHFDELVAPMRQMTVTLTSKNANLRATRDLLLPKLISGELDVSTQPEPEEAVAA